jgi:pimeloyl-ACP methyl ester carboxylesterase
MRSCRVLLLGLLWAQAVQAQPRLSPDPPPGPAAVAFADDFPALKDAQWGFPLGGFGGIRAGQRPRRVPVIFVHGNTADACDWRWVAEDFRAAGWDDQSLWALSYNGVGSDYGMAPGRPDPRCSEQRRALGFDGVGRVTHHEVNVPDLQAFILAVREYTGSRRYALVGHSLGVTLARRTLQVHPGLRQDLVAFVGIAGGNHGTSLCPPGSEGALAVCAELAPGAAWLARLNGPQGADETYPPAQWMTIYDSSGEADAAFRGEELAHSPALRGADNRRFPGTPHNDLRVRPEIVAVYRGFLAAAAPPCRWGWLCRLLGRAGP